jgi:alpha-tubulin suppressor-like RCC1 family protein
MDARARMRALQMQPGQAHTPIRVGCEDVSAVLLQQQLQQQQQQGLQEGQDGTGLSSSSDSSSSSLSDEIVVSMAASKYFSAAVTSKGELWTFGACYNGALGSQGASW